MPAHKTKLEIHFDKLRAGLKLKSLTSETTLRKNHPAAAQFFDAKKLRPGKIRDHAARLLTSGALAGSLLLASHSGPTQAQFNAKTSLYSDAQIRSDLLKKLRLFLPKEIGGKLTSLDEQEISREINEVYGVKAVAELDGNRLNQSYGRMGAEQHLPRYPGDSAAAHGTLVEKGITPGRGAWGYFAYSKAQLTPELEATEKYYVAVQTLYLPDWNSRTKELAEWYKYRRVVVVNPANGKAMVCAVADAGPANWTGKHFGGSPEVMQYLGIDYGKQNHPVVLLFLDDPDKKVPLGPLEYNNNERLVLRG